MLQQQQNLGGIFATCKMHLSPPPPPPPPRPVALAAVRSKAVVLLLLILCGFCKCSMFCCALLCVHYSFAITSMVKRELVALLCLSSWCLVIVMWLLLTMPRVFLQVVTVVFPDHTQLLIPCFFAPLLYYRKIIFEAFSPKF